MLASSYSTFSLAKTCSLSISTLVGGEARVNDETNRTILTGHEFNWVFLSSIYVQNVLVLFSQHIAVPNQAEHKEISPAMLALNAFSLRLP